MSECCRIIRDRAALIPLRRIFLLPIPTTRDNLTITGTETTLEELCLQISGGDGVAGYGIPEEIKKKLIYLGAKIYDGADDEDFLLQNADITAKGTVGYLLTEYDRDISDLKIGIVGYGRIGSCLLRYLLYLGSDVTVFTTRDSVARELCESGVSASVGVTDLSRQEVLLNTAPARLLADEEALEFMKRARIIDLASGKIFPESENLVKMASVPEKMYPTSAGKAYAERIIKYFSEEGRLC